MKKILFMLMLLALAAGASGSAQQPAAPAPSQGGFVPVSQLPQQAEQLPAAPLLIGAYAFVWIALMVYVWSLWKRMTRIERELADLQRRVQKH
jgi:CcmD family protein